MAIAVLVLLIGFAPVIFVDVVGNLLNLDPALTEMLHKPYLELLSALLGIQ